MRPRFRRHLPSIFAGLLIAAVAALSAAGPATADSNPPPAIESVLAGGQGSAAAGDADGGNIETSALSTPPDGAQPQSLLPPSFAAPDCPCEGDLIAAAGFPAEQVGYLLFDPATGAVVASRNADQPFIPASVQKVPTMLAGLSLLGPDYRFETEVLGSGPLSGGTLKGDLWLKGGGDPFLTTDDVLNFVLSLKDQGVTGVEGGFYYDASSLPVLSEINDRQPVAVSYNPGVSALTVNFNIVEVSWARMPETGELTGFALSRSDTLDVAAESIAFEAMPQPLSKRIPFLLDRAAAVAGQSNIETEQAVIGERWLLSPTLPKEGEAVLPVKSPALNAAMIFRRLAADQGIALPLPEAGRAPGEGMRLYGQHESVALDRVAQLVLRYSNNLSAELVGLAATRVLGGATDDLARSGQAVAAWLKRQIPWADWTGFLAANHSGLSSDSRMTPRQAMAILQYAWGVRGEQFDLYALLAPVRWTDDLNEDRGEEETELSVRAKSGTLWYSRALVGYMLTDNGRTLGFALFIGDLAQRDALDASMNVDELAEVPGARAWMKRAKELEKALVTRWAKGY